MNCPAHRGLSGLGVILALIILALTLAGCAQDSGHAAASPPVTAQVSVPQHLSAAGEAALRGWIEAGQLPGLRWPNFSDHRLDAKNFYEPAGYVLAWVRGGQPTPQGLAITEVFQQAASKGLGAEDYDAPRWAGRIARLRQSSPPPSDSDLANFDLALTVCVMRYINDLHIGKVNPKTFHFGLDIEQKKYNLPDFLRQKLVDADAQNVKTVLDGVEPPFEVYRRTQKALGIYEDLARRDDGEQLAVPLKPVGPGDPYPSLARLARLLRLVGDLPPGAAIDSEPQIYQGALVDAVKRFQQRHGLDTDGRLGAETVKQLNVPLSQRVEQLRLTLERWRWAPHDLGRPLVIVNIPEFVLRGWDEQNRTVLVMKVVLGKAYRHKTPVFFNQMRYVIFRPYWEVPPSIQRAELVPKIAKDSNYLAKNDFEVVDRNRQAVDGGAAGAEMLQRLRAGELSIRQRPGRKNSLGLVKFLFPNEYNVYLHGTPAPELFKRSRRDFSHGCIRVESPVDLAVWVLKDNPEWTRERILAAMNGGHPVPVNLAKPIPVLIFYGTAIVLENGEVGFFRDIYGHDAELKEVLAKGYPYP